MAIVIRSAVQQGIDAVSVEVEVDLLKRLPAITIVGLPASEVKESTERVRSAIVSSGIDFPRKRVVINLAPADLRKDGTALDLPIAIGILAADGRLKQQQLDPWLLVGELSLDGRLREIQGGLALALLSKELDKTLVVPHHSAQVARQVPGARVVSASTLSEVIDLLAGRQIPSPPPVEAPPPPQPPAVDLSEVRGQPIARMALEVSATGGHHLLFVGPPGCGKSMLARRLPTILPPLDFEAACTVSRIHTAAGLTPPYHQLPTVRPFRAPHSSISTAGMLGDQSLRPGEMALAHEGVLFLDEAVEAKRPVLESLRQPLETQTVVLSRAKGTVTFPAALTLVLAVNPCPCGWYGVRSCSCTNAQITNYYGRLSGPILDRVDLQIRLEPIGIDDWVSSEPGESSEEVRRRVVASRKRAKDRGQTCVNAQLSDKDLDRFAPLNPSAKHTWLEAIRALGLSARRAQRVRRIARTIADIAGCDHIEKRHVAQAIAFRQGPR